MHQISAGDRVSLRRAIPTFGGRVPAGSVGTIEDAYETRGGSRRANVRLLDGRRMSLVMVEDLEQLEGDCGASETAEADDDDRVGGVVHGPPRGNEPGIGVLGAGDRQPDGVGTAVRQEIQADHPERVAEPVADDQAGGSAESVATAIDRLQACGWAIAERGFSGNRRFCSRGDLKASWNDELGLLAIWGTEDALTIEQVEAEFGDDPQPREFPLTAPQRAWIKRCERAGFELVGRPKPPVGNVDAFRDGDKFTLLPFPQTIMDMDFGKHKIREFEPAAEIKTTGNNCQEALFA